ncbi:MAG: ankyrin repeat domain-containing protein [Fibrella sp.]|nr:ankyrin repeat domain-containing protein [Armatimonadota bacterium]
MGIEEIQSGMERRALFRECIRNNDAVVLGELLSDETFTNSMRPEGANSVAVAATFGHRAVLELLIEHDFPLNERGNQGEALLNACRGHLSEDETLSLVRYLLHKGADTNPPGQTPLHFAARIGYARVIECLLEAGANPSARAYGKGWQPLHELCWGDYPSQPEENRLTIAKMLVSRGADVNDSGGLNRTTPLCRAAASGFVPMMHFLIENGADPNIVDDNGDSPLHKSIVAVHQSRHAPAKNPIDVVFAREMITLLLDAGANIRTANKKGETPIFLAIQCPDHRVVFDLLLTHGADVDALTGEGVSPLALATSLNDGFFVECLLAHHSDPLAGEKGRSAIEAAIHAGLDAILKKLLSALKSKDLAGLSVQLIESAAREDAADCLRLVIPYGVNLATVFPRNKMSPLHTAARAGSVKVLEMCLQAGSDPDVPDRLGRTPLYMAARYNRPDAVEILLRFGADPNRTAKDGKTPLAIAHEKNKKRAIVALTEYPASANTTATTASEFS